MKADKALPEKFIETYQKAEVIFSENKPGKDMYIIYSGEVGLYIQGKQGKRNYWFWRIP